MDFTQEQIEYLHNKGIMPNWAYYQCNGMSAEHNYQEQRNRIYQRIQQQEEEEELENTLSAILADLFQDFSKTSKN